MKIIKKIYAWSCDLRDNQGEGILGNKFLEKFSEYSNVKIIATSPYLVTSYYKGKIINRKKNKNMILHKIKFGSLIEKYFSPIYGTFYLWFNFFCGRRVCYVNYLPLWNTILFALLPPGTIFGPITGGKSLSSHNSLGILVRKYLFPILYRLNLIILYYRKKSILFSTDLLSDYISERKRKDIIFNFNLSNFLHNKKVPSKKKIDLIFYYRKHPTKNNFFINDITKKLLNLNLEIHVVGDKLEIKGIKNHGYISRKKIFSLLANSRFTIASGENLHSIFIIDSMSSNVKVFFDKKNLVKNFIFEKKNFIKIDFNNLLGSCNIIKSYIKKKSLFSKNKLSKLILLEKKFDKHFKSLNI